MISVIYRQFNNPTGEIIVRATAVSLLLWIIWIYLAVVFSPVWLPYKFASSAYRLSRSLGVL